MNDLFGQEPAVKKPPAKKKKSGGLATPDDVAKRLIRSHGRQSTDAC